LEFNVPFQHKYGYIRDKCVVWTSGAAHWWFRMYTSWPASIYSQKRIFSSYDLELWPM